MENTEGGKRGGPWWAEVRRTTAEADLQQEVGESGVSSNTSDSRKETDSQWTEGRGFLHTVYI